MGDTLHVLIPVTVVQIRHQSTGSLWQVIRVLLDALMVGQLFDEDDMLLIGRELKAVDARLIISELFAVSAIGVHAPHLSVTQESDLTAVVDPCGIGLALAAGGQQFLVLTVGIHDIEHMVTLIFFYTIVSDVVHDLRTVGRGSIATDTAHRPESLRRQQITFQLDVVLSNWSSHVVLRIKVNRCHHEDDEHHDTFSHSYLYLFICFSRSSR